MPFNRRNFLSNAYFGAAAIGLGKAVLAAEEKIPGFDDTASNTDTSRT